MKDEENRICALFTRGGHEPGFELSKETNALVCMFWNDKLKITFIALYCFGFLEYNSDCMTVESDITPGQVRRWRVGSNCGY